MKNQYRRAFISIAFILSLLFWFGGCARNAESSSENTFEEEQETSVAQSVPGENSAVDGSVAAGNTLEKGDAETPTAPQIEFKCVDLDGNTVTAGIFAESKLTMVNVWATYCNPCLREMPGLGELAAEYDPEEFQIIGIVSDVLEGGDSSLAQDLVEQTGAAYPHLLLNQSVYMALLTDVTAVPTTFFINENGEILDTVVGSMPKSAWEEMIDALLES